MCLNKQRPDGRKKNRGSTMSVSLNSASFTSVWMISLRKKKYNKTPAAFSWNQLNLGAKIPVCQEISWLLRKAIDTAAELKRREGKTYFIFPSSYWKIALTTKSYLFHRDAIVCCNQTDPFLICPIRRRTANNPPKNPVQIGKGESDIIQYTKFRRELT